MQDFHKLKVWEKSHALVLELYQVTESFPKKEQFALTSQIQRAAVSIPTNIAEGCGKATSVDFKRYLQIAMGSSSELEYLLFLSRDLKYIEKEKYESLNASLVEIRKMLNGLIQSIKLSIKTTN
jgi:four helix bundle protein